MPRTLHALALVTILTLVTLGLPASIFTQSTTPEPVSTTFGMFVASSPTDTYFKVDLEPGNSATLTAGISNTGTTPVDLRVFATNAYNPPNGGFAAGEEEDERTGPALWVNFEAMTVELAPGDRKTMDFTITVPEGTAPGQYTAALVARTAESLDVPGTANFRQILRSALPVTITVPGPENPGFELGSPVFSTGGEFTMVQIPLTNTGNMRLKPQGALTITTSDGTDALSANIAMRSVFIGSDTLVQVALPASMQAGDYLVSIDLTDPENNVHAGFTDVRITLPNRASLPDGAMPSPSPET